MTVEWIMTVEEAAKRLGIGVWSVYRLIHNREITYYKIGKKYFITEEYIQEYLKRNTFAASAPDSQ